MNNATAQRPDPGMQALADALQVSFRALRAAMVVLLVLYLASGVFIVRQDERAMVLVFGRLQGTGAERLKEPGLHWTWPRPIGEVVRVRTEQIQSLETTTFTVPPPAPGQPATPPGGDTPLRPGTDGYSLTGDANLMHSRWALRYRVTDPEWERFRVADVTAVLHRELDRAIQRVAAEYPIDRALRTDLESFRAAVADRLTQQALRLGFGVQIVAVEILSVAPPRQVADAFSAVIAAEQERSEKISAARAEAARLLNEAQGQAARLRAEAAAYQRRVVSEVSADADYFLRVHAEYEKNPDVVARTLLQDTLRRGLASVQEKFVLPVGTPGQQLRLLLNRAPQSPWLEQE